MNKLSERIRKWNTPQRVPDVENAFTLLAISDEVAQLEERNEELIRALLVLIDTAMNLIKVFSVASQESDNKTD